jgi:hypothetical protein
MHHPHPQHILKRIEITFTVQKLVPGQQAECSDPTIHSFPNGIPALAQGPVVHCHCDRVCSASRRKYIEPEKLIPHPSKFARVTNTLQNFAEDHVGKTASTVALFVSIPPSRMACRIKLSSMSILVRIGHSPNV